MSSSDVTTEAEVEEEAAAEPDTAREGLVERITAELGDAVVGSHIDPGVDVWVRLDRAAWGEAAAYLRNGLGFGYFSFLSAIDWLPSPFGRDMDSQVDIALEGADAAPAEAGDGMEQGVAGGDTRFQVFARVNDVVDHLGLTLKADLPDDDLSIASWTQVYPGSNWHEREAWEMFGIEFTGHPGLRHIYLPGTFEGNPLRKDYPLLARRVKPWPGIVDVEAMPGEDDEETGDEADPESGEQP